MMGYAMLFVAPATLKQTNILLKELIDINANFDKDYDTVNACIDYDTNIIIDHYMGKFDKVKAWV